MILAVDTHYSDASACTAGVLFDSWSDVAAVRNLQVRSSEPPAKYEPGQFYKREMPLILDLLGQLSEPPSTIVIDGYVTLNSEGRKGLGAHLSDALEGAIPVIGVGKTAFQGSLHAAEVYRGTSQRPLYVTASGIRKETAAASIKSMHGAHRIPALLKLADQLSREDPVR